MQKARIPANSQTLLLSSLCFFGPGELYNFYLFMNHIDHKEKRMLCCDGTFGILPGENSTLLTMGAVCVDSSPDEPSEVRRKFRPLIHLLTKGESTYATTVLAFALELLGVAMFGKSPEIGHFVSDFSLPIRNGLKEVFPEIKQHLCFPHIIRSVDKKIHWKKKMGSDLQQKVVSRVRYDVYILVTP